MNVMQFEEKSIDYGWGQQLGGVSILSISLISRDTGWDYSRGRQHQKKDYNSCSQSHQMQEFSNREMKRTYSEVYIYGINGDD